MLVGNTVQVVKLPASPCLKHFGQVVSNFPGLRAAVRSIGLEPTFINFKKQSYGCSGQTIVGHIDLSHDHLPEFYRNLMKINPDLKRINIVARTQLYYKPNKHLVFFLDDDRDGCYWLDRKRNALHLDLTANEWSWGHGKTPSITSNI